MSGNNYNSPFLFDATDILPIQEWVFGASQIKPDQYEEWNGICVCGKIEKDGIRCKFGASHMTTTMHEAQKQWESMAFL